MDFKSLLQHQQRVLELELALARERFAHMGLRGNALEIAVRNFLEQHIPRALSVGTGEVIASQSDTQERTSGQIDVVISNMFQPFISARDMPTTFLLEGVHMAGEVKTSLTRSAMRNELVKSTRFRSLRAQNVSRLANVPKPDTWETYYVFYRPYFLLAVEATNWKPLLLEIMEHIRTTRRMPLDGVFLLDQNIVILLSPHMKFPFSEVTGIPFEHDVQGSPVTGGIHIYNCDVPLALLLGWTSLFRGSYFDDQQPIGFYLEAAINESLNPINLIQTGAFSEAQQNLIELGPFEFIRQVLEVKFPWKSSLDEDSQ